MGAGRNPRRARPRALARGFDEVETHAPEGRREFVEAAFSRVGVTVEWRGEGTSEVGVDADGALGEPGILVQVDPDVAEQERERYLQEGGLVATPLRGRRCSAKQPGYEVKNCYE